MGSRIQVLVCLILFGWGYAVRAQDLLQYDRQMNKATNRSMAVLGGWAIGNMVTSGILLPFKGGSERHFHEMNIGWNLVNFGIAASGWLDSRRLRPDGDQDIIRRHERMRQILIFNAGLDLGYMAAGGWMMERSRRQGSEDHRLKGFGKSLILQGGFLFLFDLGTFLVLDSRHRFFDLQCTTSGNGLTMTWKF